MLMFYRQSFLFQSTLHNAAILIVTFIFILLLGYGLTKIRADNKKINLLVLGSLLAIFVIIATTWALIVPTKQISDFGNFWNRAAMYTQGVPIYYSPTDYFAKYAYQSGFLVYVVTVIKLFGINIIAIQLLNVLYQALTLLFIYLLVIKIFDNVKAARLGILVLMFNFDWFTLNSQASNQYLGSLLYLITFYLLMQDKLWSYILAGVTLTAGCLIRPIGPVIIAGIVVFGILYAWFKNNNYRKALKIVLSLAIYLALFSLAGWGIKASGINQYGLTNNDTEWKFMTGLHYQSVGTYDPSMNDFIDDAKPREVTRKIEQKQIKAEIDYLNTHHAWLRFFLKKTQLLWSTRTMATDFSNFSVNHSAKLSNDVNFFAYVGSIVLIVFSWIGSLELFKTKFDDNLYLLILPLMAFAVAQLLIEVQGRYRIEFLPILAVIGGIGLYKTIKSFKGLNTKLFNRKLN